MINNIPKPDISQDFTIKDIHKIREWEYERLKDATHDEYHADIEQRMAVALKRLGLPSEEFEKLMILRRVSERTV